MDLDGCGRDARRLAQEGDLALVALDEVDALDAQDRQDQAGKAGAAAEVDQGSGRGRQVMVELGAIQDVPPPGIGQGPGADQIDRPLPAVEETHIAAQPAQRFT
jgi:hypothetical protein